jgi:protein involved in polysaccharide export with SLBB domain
MKIHQSIFSSLTILFFLSSPIYSEISEEQQALLGSLPADQQANIRNKMLEADGINKELEEVFENFETVTKRPKAKEKDTEEEKINIFGYDLFSGSPTTFAQSTNIPVPSNYIIGAGDELIFQFFGSKNQKKSSFVSRTGEIVVPFLGPVNVNGLTLDEAKKYISSQVKENLLGSEVYVTLGEVKSIQVYVLGEAYLPGAYTVSSLATVSNILYVSGGVSEIGSVRNIQIIRNGEVIRTFDLYDLLLFGDTSKDLPIRAGDSIFIPAFEKTAKVNGFKRNFIFEIKDDDTFKDLIEFAGGMKYLDTQGYFSLELDRFNKNTLQRERTLYTDLSSLQDTVIQDGDMLSLQKTVSDTVGSIELKGEFAYPGTYSIQRGEKLSSVVKRAGGFTNQAYTYASVFTRKPLKKLQKLSFEQAANDLEYAVAAAITSPSARLQITGEGLKPISDLIIRLREQEAAGRMVVDFTPLSLSQDPSKDISLVDGDMLLVPSRPSDITISGEVRYPISIKYDDSKSWQDYIDEAGGFATQAAESSIFIIYPNGKAIVATKPSLWAKTKTNLQPGSTIVVPRSSRSYDALGLSVEIAPIIASIATSIAALSVISNDG